MDNITFFFSFFLFFSKWHFSLIPQSFPSHSSNEFSKFFPSEFGGVVQIEEMIKIDHNSHLFFLFKIFLFFFFFFFFELVFVVFCSLHQDPALSFICVCVWLLFFVKGFFVVFCSYFLLAFFAIVLLDFRVCFFLSFFLFFECSTRILVQVFWLGFY